MNSVNDILNFTPAGPTIWVVSKQGLNLLSRQMYSSPESLFLPCELTDLSLRKVVAKFVW